METIINSLGKMPAVHICLNFVEACAQSNIFYLLRRSGRKPFLLSFFFFFTLNYAPFKKGFLYYYVSIDAVQKNNAMTSCYEGQPERLEFPRNIPCPRNCKHRLATSPGEGGTQQFLYGEALYTIFHEKGAPFEYLLVTNGTPFTFLV